MLIRKLLLALAGVSFGLLSASGVFTVLASVGLTPRFAGKTHTSSRVMLYENMIALGTITGGVVSVYWDSIISLANSFREDVPGSSSMVIGQIFLAAFGIFSGMFVGCLALAIAEMLDSIPIFSRRIHFRQGITFAVCAVAVGKLFGSAIYYFFEIYLYGG